MLGGDPEFFILSPTGESVPAHIYFPPKGQPLVVEGAGKIFRDGFAVELNPLPSPNLSALISNMGRLFAAAKSMMPKGYQLSALSTVRVDLEKLVKSAPADVLESGCHPSYNAYNLTNEAPSLRLYPMRHAGGHIHLSPLNDLAWPLTRPDLYPTLVMLMDALLGARMRDIMDYEAYKQRSDVYGRWGEYREQLYPGDVRGLEYRVLGNEVWCHPAITTLCYGLARYVVLNLAGLQYGEKVLNRLGCITLSDVPKRLDNVPGVCPFSIPGFYSPLIIRALRNIFTKRQMVVDEKEFIEWGEDGMGWKDWADKHQLLVPIVVEDMPRIGVV